MLSIKTSNLPILIGSRKNKSKDIANDEMNIVPLATIKIVILLIINMKIKTCQCDHSNGKLFILKISLVWILDEPPDVSNSFEKIKKLTNWNKDNNNIPDNKPGTSFILLSLVAPYLVAYKSWLTFLLLSSENISVQISITKILHNTLKNQFME